MDRACPESGTSRGLGGEGRACSGFGGESGWWLHWGGWKRKGSWGFWSPDGNGPGSPGPSVPNTPAVRAGARFPLWGCLHCLSVCLSRMVQLTVSGIINPSLSPPFFCRSLFSCLPPAWDLPPQLLSWVSPSCLGQRSWPAEWGEGKHKGAQAGHAVCACW